MSVFLGIVLLLATSVVLASPAEELEETRIPILDTAEEFFGHRVNHLANDFDSFFATDRADDELGRSRLRIRYNETMEERANGVNNLQYRFNMRLPKLQQWFKNLAEEKKRKKKGQVETIEEKRKREESYLNKNRVDERWLVNGDMNANASIHPSITVRARLRKTLETGVIINRFVQEASWVSTLDGFRQRTILTNDYSINQNLLFRFTNEVDWRISRKTFITNHGPGIFQRITDFDAISYTASMSTTVINDVWYVSNFQLAPNYRHNLYKEIFYFDFTPGINFPKQWSFRRTPFIFVGIELLFGGN